MTVEELASAADAAEANGCGVRVVVTTPNRPGSNRRAAVYPGLVGDVVARDRADGGGYVRHILLNVADVRAFVAAATPLPGAAHA